MGSPAALPTTPNNKHRLDELFETSPKKLRSMLTKPSQRLKPTVLDFTPDTQIIWNQFIHPNQCAVQFEDPSEKIKLSGRTIYVNYPEAFKNVEESVVLKIVEIAHFLLPNCYVYYKKGTVIKHPVDTSKPTQVLTSSFYIAAVKDKIFACLPLEKNVINVVGEGSTGKVRKAIGFIFQKTQHGVKLSNIFSAVKHTARLGVGDPKTNAILLKRAKSRLEAAVKLKDTPHVASPHFHGIYTGKNQITKLVMTYDCYRGSILKFQSSTFSDENRFKNTLIAAIHIGEALRSVHSKGFIHRDVKDDNILAQWESVKKETLDEIKTLTKETHEEIHTLTKVDLTDFDVCTTTRRDDPRFLDIAGTREFASPEVLAKNFSFDEFFTILNIDPSTITGTNLDTWGYGIVLYNLLYNKFPECVLLMSDYNRTLFKLADAKSEDEIKQHNCDLAEITKEWEKFMLKTIEDQNLIIAPSEETLESFIDELLHIDPRKRPTDKQIEESLTKLKNKYQSLL